MKYYKMHHNLSQQIKGNFVNAHLKCRIIQQMFGSKQCNLTLHQAKIDQHECDNKIYSRIGLKISQLTVVNSKFNRKK